MAKSTNTVLAAYTNFTKNWPKQAGPVPSNKELEQAEEFGLRSGRKGTFAVAMYLRKDGATTGQVSMAVGGPQLNVRRKLIDKKAAFDVRMPNNEAGHKVYKISLAPAKVVKKSVKKAVTKKQASAPVTPQEPAPQELTA